jgi:hypothetical protein
MAFEVFDKRQTTRSKAPLVTIQKRGVISFNRAAHALIDEAEMVELLYDRDDEIVGIRPVSNDVPHGYPVRAQSATRSTGPLLIAGTAFVQYYGIDTTMSRRWTPYMRGDVLCIDLSTPGTPIIGNRSKNASRTHDGDE